MAKKVARGFSPSRAVSIRPLRLQLRFPVRPDYPANGRFSCLSPHVPYPLVHNGRSCPSRYVGCCQDIRTLAATGRCSSFSPPSPAPRLIDYICRLYSAMCFRHAMLRNGIYDTARCSLHSAVSIMPHGLVYVQLQGQKCTAYGLT